jgi:hypothetical protein
MAFGTHAPGDARLVSLGRYTKLVLEPSRTTAALPATSLDRIMMLGKQLAEPYQTALDEAVRFVVERFDPWGVIVSGTIIRGDPDLNSDLDVYVLHDAPFRQRVQRWFHGVPVEVFVNPEAAVLNYIDTESREGRPSTAHMLATGNVVFSRDPERVARLRRHALASLDTPPSWSPLELVRARYAAATLVEDAVDKRDVDAVGAMRLLGMAMEPALSYWFKSRGAYQPRSKDTLAAVVAVDPVLSEHLSRLWGGATLDDRWEAGIMAAELILETRGFFEWESDPEPVPSS